MRPDTRRAFWRLTARVPIPAELDSAVEVWVGRSHRWPARVTSSYTAAVVFAFFGWTYALTGHLALGILAIVMIPVWLLAMGIWGGTRNWERANRPRRAVAPVAVAMTERIPGPART